MLNRRMRLRSRGRDQRGASAVEYGLLIAGIAAIIALSVFAFGNGMKGSFSKSCSTILSTASQGTC